MNRELKITLGENVVGTLTVTEDGTLDFSGDVTSAARSFIEEVNIMFQKNNSKPAAGVSITAPTKEPEVPIKTISLSNLKVTSNEQNLYLQYDTSDQLHSDWFHIYIDDNHQTITKSNEVIIPIKELNIDKTLDTHLVTVFGCYENFKDKPINWTSDLSKLNPAWLEEHHYSSINSHIETSFTL